MWKDIPDFEGYYQVSDEGKIKGLERTLNNRTYPEQLIKTCLDKDGYEKVRLRKNGEIKYFHVHRLVALMFVPNPDSLPQVNHKNGIRNDNTAGNLEWCDNSYNQWHRCHINNNPPDNNYKKKKVQIDILEQGSLIFDSVTECALYLNVSRTAVERKLKGLSSNPSIKPSSKLYNIVFNYVD